MIFCSVNLYSSKTIYWVPMWQQLPHWDSGDSPCITINTTSESKRLWRFGWLYEVQETGNVVFPPCSAFNLSPAASLIRRTITGIRRRRVCKVVGARTPWQVVLMQPEVLLWFGLDRGQSITVGFLPRRGVCFPLDLTSNTALSHRRISASALLCFLQCGKHTAGCSSKRGLRGESGAAAAVVQQCCFTLPEFSEMPAMRYSDTFCGIFLFIKAIHSKCCLICIFRGI